MAEQGRQESGSTTTVETFVSALQAIMAQFEMSLETAYEYAKSHSTTDLSKDAKLLEAAYKRLKGTASRGRGN